MFNEDTEIPWGAEDPAAVQKGIDHEFKRLHAEVAEGNRTTAELKQAAEKAASDLRALDLKVAEAANQARLRAEASRIDGPETQLRNFVSRDGAQETVRLFNREVVHRGHSLGHQAGLLDSPETYGDWHRKAKDLYEATVLHTLCTKSRHEGLRDPKTLRNRSGKLLAQLEHHLKQGPGAVGRIASEQVARVFTDTDGSGGEFIPDQIVMPELDRATILTSYGLASDNLAVLDLTGKNMRMPFLDSAPQPYIYGKATTDDPTDFTATTPGTSDKSITPVGLAVRVAMDRDALDDSLVPALPELREIISRALALACEDANVNADTTASHQDAIASWNPNNVWPSGATRGGTGDHRRAWLGWRARANDIGSGAKLDLSGSLTFAKIQQLAGLFSPTQSADGDMALVVSYAAYLEHILAIEQVATLDKYGPQAGVLSGEVARVGSFRILKSPFVTDDLNASGVYDGVTTTKAAILGVNLSRYRKARRRARRVELDVNVLNGVVNLVATIREVLHDRDNGPSGLTSASVRNVVYGYNL